MIDLCILLAFVAYAVSAGFRARKKASESMQEYFLAGRTIKGWRAGFSMAATQFAADTPLLVTGLIATGGIFMVWRLWIYGIAFLMLGFIFAANWRRAGVLTDAELTEARYSGNGVLALRTLKAVYYGTVINCVVLAMVLVAAMRIAEVFLPWHAWLPDGLYNVFLAVTQGLGLHLGESTLGLAPEVTTTNNLISILAIISFTALYSTTGGLRSVIATDVVQFTLAMFGTMVYGVVIIQETGGLRTLTEKTVEIYGPELASNLLSFTPKGGECLLPFLILIGLQWLFQMNSDGTGYLAQRSMACRSDREARIAALIFTVVQIFLRSLIWLVIGVGLLIVYPFTPGAETGEQFAASREILFVTGIQDLLPPGFRGLLLTALLAALASTIDTHLNWGAGYWSNDVYRRLISQHWLKRDPQRRELVLVARLSNILIVAIALVIMANLGSIQTAWYISLLFGAGMGSVLVLRWLWERITLYSELAAMATSLIVAPILLVSTDQEWMRLTVMALASTLAAIGVTYVTPATDAHVLCRFYRKVHPAGLWRKTAVAAGDDPRVPIANLVKDMQSVFLTAFSLFGMLVGVGTLLIPAPDQAALTPWMFIIAAVLAVPLWWNNALKSEKITAEDLPQKKI
jgi:solute:Na+ symporter, SSS family